MKKIISLLVAVFVIVAGFVYFSRNVEAPEVDADVLGSFKNWKTYDGKAYFGLTLKYPGDWVVNFDQNYPDNVILDPVEGNGFAVLTIESQNKKQTVDQWIKARDKEANEAMGGQYKTKILSSKKTKVDKISAVRRVEFAAGAGFNIIHTYLKKGDRYYLFTLVVRGDGYTPEDEKVYDKIISTVKFSK